MWRLEWQVEVVESRGRCKPPLQEKGAGWLGWARAATAGPHQFWQARGEVWWSLVCEVCEFERVRCEV